MKEVIAILCSDIHLSLTPPVGRSAEPDWLAAQGRMLKQLCELKYVHQCPIVCAGDVFEKWNPSPEIINWAIHNLPSMYAVPGNHDTPLHNYEDIRKSAYQNLVLHGVIKNIFPDEPIEIGKLIIHGFPFGTEIRPIVNHCEGYVCLAVCHAYIWKTGYGFPGAPIEHSVAPYQKKLNGYDAAVFGDNHSGFVEGNIINTGCLIQRHRNERQYAPQVGLLYDDGIIGVHLLDISEDVWLPDDIEVARSFEVSEELEKFLAELKKQDQKEIDFRESVKQYLLYNKVGDGARKVILETMDV